MKNLLIEPEKIKVFSNCFDKHFCLITNRELDDSIQLKAGKNFISGKKYFLDKDTDLTGLLVDTIPDNACVLVISPFVFFQSPPQKTLGKKRVIAMACNSTPTNLEDIAHFWNCLINTDPQEQQTRTDHFFEIGEKARYLQFVDFANDTSAEFMHMDESYLWSEQTGILNDGEQQLAPSGEISVLPIDIQDFNENLRLNFNGQIALNGTPILHNGTPSYTRKDQLRIHTNLSEISISPIIATVENGEITKIQSKNNDSKNALKSLDSLFETDSRYRILWEIGFGINKNISIREGNHAMNETYGSHSGCIHFGLGLTPYTQYHLDIICPNTNVLTDTGIPMIGTGRKSEKKFNIMRNRQTSCPCNEVQL